MTVHESSLSPCVHSILAAQLGYHEKAVEMYQRTARLDPVSYTHLDVYKRQVSLSLQTSGPLAYLNGRTFAVAPSF